ncbi:hypothetical protein P3T18_006290 [Paraburkholderia sp. GAS199]|uniref:hypothetical protein n=1 Tax=Paraburkholderia sp. GAS199 TaxID=3035126 RepID=UPI003D241A57
MKPDRSHAEGVIVELGQLAHLLVEVATALDGQRQSLAALHDTLERTSGLDGALAPFAEQSRQFLDSEVRGAQQAIQTTAELNAGMSAQVALLTSVVQEARELDDDTLTDPMRAALWDKMSPRVDTIISSVNHHLSLALGTLDLAARVIERSHPIWQAASES